MDQGASKRVFTLRGCDNGVLAAAFPRVPEPREKRDVAPARLSGTIEFRVKQHGGTFRGLSPMWTLGALMLFVGCAQIWFDQSIYLIWMCGV